MKDTDLGMISEWVGKVVLYPPSEIYFGAPKSKEKQERKVKEVCEQLYRFNWEGSKTPNPIGAMRETYREMVCINNVFQSSNVPPKVEYMVSLCAKWWVQVKAVEDALMVMHRSHPVLEGYYTPWMREAISLTLWAMSWASTEVLGYSKEDKEKLSSFAWMVYDEHKKLTEGSK